MKRLRLEAIIIVQVFKREKKSYFGSYVVGEMAFWKEKKSNILRESGKKNLLKVKRPQWFWHVS